MNGAHLHLILNHIPVIALPLALVFFVHSLRKGNESSRRMALSVLAIAAFSALPAFLTGEPAEEVVEHLPGVVESMIHAHEEAGEVAMVLSMITGVLALGGLFLERLSSGSPGPRLRLSRIAVVASSLMAVAALGITPSRGGVIRHTEIRAAAEAASTPGDAPGDVGGDHDHDDD